MNISIKKIVGKDLDLLVEKELQEMLQEGYDLSPISAKVVHLRLLEKQIINGGRSTLSTPYRKKLIAEYKDKQLDDANLTEEAKRQLSSNRSLEGYKRRYQEKCDEVIALETIVQNNIAALVDIVIAVESRTPLKIENILAPSLLKNLKVDSHKNIDTKKKLTVI